MFGWLTRSIHLIIALGLFRLISSVELSAQTQGWETGSANGPPRPAANTGPGSSQVFVGSARREAAHGQGTMRVIDVDTSVPGGLGYYTIAGGVKVSGVFSAAEPTLPLAALIQAAGGLASDRPVSVRILSTARHPLQVFVGGPSALPQELVRAGEIVIVDGESGMAPLVPVVCLGLIDRPIVLPLRPEVATLPVLLRNLEQPYEILTRVQRVDPPATPPGPQLYSGSLLIFDPQMISQLGIKRVQQERAFPPVVELSRALGQAAPAASGASLNSPPAGGLVYRDFTPAVSDTADPLPLISARTAERTAALPAPAFGTQEAAPVQELFAPTPVEELSLPMLPSPGDKAVTTPAPLSREPEISTLAPALPAPPATASKLPEAEYALEAVPAVPAPLALESLPRVTLAGSETPLPAQAERAPSMPATAEPALAPPPPEERRAGTFRQPPLPRETVVILPNEQVAGEAVSLNESPAKRTGKGWWILLAIVAVLGTATCGIWTLGWPLPRMVIQFQSVSEDRIQRQPEIQPEAVAGSVPAMQPPAASRTLLEEVIEQALPVYEEPIQLTNPAPLHGEAIGHRRLIVHEGHAGVPAPKFAKRPATQDQFGERDLRERLRHVIRETNSDPRRSSFTAVQTEPAPAGQFDVVQPVSERSRKSRPAAGMSPLDRALGALQEEGTR